MFLFLLRNLWSLQNFEAGLGSFGYCWHGFKPCCVLVLTTSHVKSLKWQLNMQGYLSWSCRIGEPGSGQGPWWAKIRPEPMVVLQQVIFVWDSFFNWLYLLTGSNTVGWPCLCSHHRQERKKCIAKMKHWSRSNWPEKVSYHKLIRGASVCSLVA